MTGGCSNQLSYHRKRNRLRYGEEYSGFESILQRGPEPLCCVPELKMSPRFGGLIMQPMAVLVMNCRKQNKKSNGVVGASDITRDEVRFGIE